MLLCDCGVGKTIIELSIISHRLKMGLINKALVIAPKSILRSAWERDILKFYPDLSYEIFWDKDMDSRRDMITNSKAQIGIINYEGVKKCQLRLEQTSFDQIVLDESTRIKNHASKTCKTILDLAKRAKFRTAMTATPGHRPEHYWSLLTLLGVTRYSFFAFREKFCYSYALGNTGLKVWKPKTEMYPLLREYIFKKAVKLSKEECLDLPEKVFSVREITLPAEAMKLYKQMQKDNVIEYQGEVIMAPFSMVLRQKLRQMANGILYGEKTRYRFHDAKLKEVDALVEGADGQVIIWADFEEDIDMIADRFGFSTYHGKTKDKQKADDDFVAGKSRGIVCHPLSAGHGLTWVNCHIHIFYSLPCLEYYLQAQDRTHRIGQTNKCIYYILVSKDTVDEMIWEKLSVNEDYQDELIRFSDQNMSYNKQ